jgi:hypothetical protein
VRCRLLLHVAPVWSQPQPADGYDGRTRYVVLHWLVHPPSLWRLRARTRGSGASRLDDGWPARAACDAGWGNDDLLNATTLLDWLSLDLLVG